MLLATLLAPSTTAQQVITYRKASSLDFRQGLHATPSGIYDFRGVNFGTGLTECPQAGKIDRDPAPLDRRQRDVVENMSENGDDRRSNQDFACFPQNETSIAVNPRNSRNIVGGANDYRLGWGTSGFYATTDGGRDWYDGIIPFPSLPSGENLDGGGDPAIAFDRDGVVYYADINFNRTDDTNGVFVSRSTNGGFTWSRPCVPIPGASPADDVAVCGGPGDPRQPGDGVVDFNPENDLLLNDSVTFNDKEYIGIGPRPDGVAPTCFAPETKTPIAVGGTSCPADVIGSDRIYVTWTSFDNPTSVPDGIVSATIVMSYSDDRARSWSPVKVISGSAPFCLGLTPAAPNRCDNNQFSTPTISPETGHLFVAWENFNTPDENQGLMVRSKDGGATFEGPFFITPIFDVNFPRSGAGGGRPDCAARGQQNGRIVYTNSCFRSNAGGNVVVDKRGGAFADDLYFVISDNRNGIVFSSNSDVWLFKSNDGGSSWIGPTRVNNDASGTPANRDCGFVGQPACPANTHTGNDQWWPWVDISDQGDINVMFKDRRLDTNSVAHEWAPASRQRTGNYLVWTWAAQCRATQANSTQCLSDGAEVIPQPTGPIDPGAAPPPGAGDDFVGDFRNFKLSDVPSNFDYSFRAGIFAGDYDVVTVSRQGGGHDDDRDDDRFGSNSTTYALWTDARNGRSSRNQFGRNPACEQADAFFDTFNSRFGGSGGSSGNIQPFLVTPCPADAPDRHRNRSNNDD